MVEFKVVSYNCHSCVGSDGKFSVNRIADVLTFRRHRSRDAQDQSDDSCLPLGDIICLQEIECNLSEQRTRVWSAVHSIDQPQAIASRLGYDHVSFAPAITSIASSRVKEVHDVPQARNGLFGIAIVSKYPILETRIHRFARYKRKTLRNAQACLIQLSMKTRVWVVNTHLGCHSGGEQLHQAKELVRFIDTLDAAQNVIGDDGEHDVPAIILCGDFNSPTWFRRVFGVIRGSGFVDTWQAGGVGTGHGCTFPSDGRVPGLVCSAWCCRRRPFLRLDYIFLRKTVESSGKDKKKMAISLRYAFVCREYCDNDDSLAMCASDHLPICSVFET